MAKEPNYTPTPKTHICYEKGRSTPDKPGTQFPKGTNMKTPVPPQNRPY